MEVIAIGSLIFVGIILLMLEFFIITGTIVPGIIGIALMLGGVMLSYHHYGNEVGNYTLLATLLFVFVTTYKLLKSKTWKKVALNSSIDSKVNEISEIFTVGDEGVTLSRLAPMGKILVNNQVIEAKAESDFLDPKKEVVIIAIESNKVVVTRKIEI